MKHSSTGANGELEMHFEVNASGRTVLAHLHREVPMVVQQALYFDEQLPLLPCVYTLSSGGPILEGDRHRVEIILGKGAMAHISTGAATLVAPMEYGRAEVHRRLLLDDDGYLEWLPLATIPAARSRYISKTEIVASPSATLFYSEIVACGRLHRGERFDYRLLDLSEFVYRPCGKALLSSRVRLTPDYISPERWAWLDSFSHFGSIVVITPPAITERLTHLFLPRLEADLRVSVATLMDGSGFALRLLGRSSEQLQREIRHLGSIVRQEVKGVPLQEEFPWR